MPPPSCANTNMAARRGDTCLVTASDTVTAGFTWPPDTCRETRTHVKKGEKGKDKMVYEGIVTQGYL